MSEFDLVSAGGGGVLGSILGTIGTFFGLKSRMDAADRRMDQIEKDVVYRDTCTACKDGRDKQSNDFTARMDRMEGYLIEILQRVGK